jgi:hypothetical protein
MVVMADAAHHLGDVDRLRLLAASMDAASARKRALEGQLEGLIRQIQHRPPTQAVVCGELAEFGSLLLQVLRSDDLEESSMPPLPEWRTPLYLLRPFQSAPSSGTGQCQSFPSLSLRSDSESSGGVAIEPTLKVTELGEIPGPVSSDFAASGEPPIGLPGARDRNPDYPYIDPDDLLFAVAGLILSDPKIAQDVVDLRSRENARGERFSVFDYLFVDTSAPALGAKYGVCGYRGSTPEERDAARRTFLGNEIGDGGHG